MMMKTDDHIWRKLVSKGVRFVGVKREHDK